MKLTYQPVIMLSKKLFESIEPGSAARLDKFLKEAAYKYQAGINKLVL